MRFLMDIVIPDEEVLAEVSKEPSVLPAILVAAVVIVAAVLVIKAVKKKK